MCRLCYYCVRWASQWVGDACQSFRVNVDKELVAMIDGWSIYDDFEGFELDVECWSFVWLLLFMGGEHVLLDFNVQLKVGGGELRVAILCFLFVYDVF